MDTNTQFIDTIINKEKELVEREKEIKMQLDALRTTIKIFQNGNGTLPVNSDVKGIETKSEIPKTWEEALTWNSKVLFVLNRIQSGFVSDIVAEILKNAPQDEVVLFKRITSTASLMKSKKILGAKTVGVKSKYFIK